MRKIALKRQEHTAGPERFVNEGPTLTFFKVYDGGSKYRYKRGYALADDVLTLNAGLIAL